MATMKIENLGDLAEKLRMLAEVCESEEADLVELEAELDYLKDQVGDRIEAKAVPAPDKFDIFEDRVNSLLDRWRIWRDNHREDIDRVDARAVRGSIMEITDEFSQSLAE